MIYWTKHFHYHTFTGRMLKHIFPILAALFLLSACAPNISVQDFGPYWNQGKVNHSLLGWWNNPDEKDEVKIRVMNRSGTYQIDYIDKKGWEHPEASLQGRTIQVGSYWFMLIKMQDRTEHWVPFMMYRYTVEGNSTRDYTLNAKKMRLFLAKNYPGQENIQAVVCKKKETLCTPHISIRKLDNDVYKILASIPDTKAFWSLDHVSQKTP